MDTQMILQPVEVRQARVARIRLVLSRFERDPGSLSQAEFDFLIAELRWACRVADSKINRWLRDEAGRGTREIVAYLNGQPGTERR